MRDIATMKENTIKLGNHEFDECYYIGKLMRSKANDLKYILKRMSILDKVLHRHKYKRLIKKHELCKAIAGKMAGKMRYWNGLEMK